MRQDQDIAIAKLFAGGGQRRENDAGEIVAGLDERNAGKRDKLCCRRGGSNYRYRFTRALVHRRKIPVKQNPEQRRMKPPT